MGNFIVATGVDQPGPTVGAGVPVNRFITVSIVATGDGVANFEVSNDNANWFALNNVEEVATLPNGKLLRIHDTPFTMIRLNVSSITTGRIDCVAHSA